VNSWRPAILIILYPVRLTSAQFRSTLDDFNSRFERLRENYKDAMLTQIAVDVGQLRDDAGEIRKDVYELKKANGEL
jgi:hypothetical protein